MSGRALAMSLRRGGGFDFANRRGKSRVQRDGGRSSMVEPQIVVLAVAGSSPVDHPARLPGANFKVQIEISHAQTVPVAQPDRASDFGSEGWGFESLQARVLSRFGSVF